MDDSLTDHNTFYTIKKLSLAYGQKAQLNSFTPNMKWKWNIVILHDYQSRIKLCIHLYICIFVLRRVLNKCI